MKIKVNRYSNCWSGCAWLVILGLGLVGCAGSTRSKSSLTQSSGIDRAELVAQTQLQPSQELQVSQLVLPPKTRLEVRLETMCLGRDALAPDDNAVYLWESSRPAVTYYAELVELRRQRKISHRDASVLVWNLVNKTYWEHYPRHLQRVLKSMDPQAPLRLPSRARSQISQVTMRRVWNLSALDPIRPEAQLAEGLYHDYYQIADVIVESRPASESTVTQSSGVYRIGGTSLYAETVANSCDEAKATIYNATAETQKIELMDFTLVPQHRFNQSLGIVGTLKSAAATKQVAIAVGVINPRHSRPEFAFR